MGVAYYISLEKPIEGFDATSISGKALARAQPELEKICAKLKLRDLLSFYGERPGQTAELAEDLGGVLTQQLQELNDLNASLGKPPSKLFPSVAEFRKQVDEAAKEAVTKAPAKEEWFSAKEGLATVRGLLEYVRSHNIDFGKRAKSESVIRDLEQMERMLQAAETAGIRFHLSIDI